jgi:hypothetical protein
MDLSFGEWRQYAIDNGYKYLVIMKDLEDKDMFPMFFEDDEALQKHRDCIISETKMKILEIIEV